MKVGKIVKPMLLSPSIDIPAGKGWLYETKFDGFRCILQWESEIPQLISRNGKNLNKQFPEIVEFCREIYNTIKDSLPLILDGEIVYLSNNYKSEFSHIQLRGRMKTKSVISKHAENFPCHLVVFDLLKLKGENYSNQPLPQRKNVLQTLFKKRQLPTSIDYEKTARLQAIESKKNSKQLWNAIMVHNGEGIVAKRETSLWESGKRTPNWLKIKNYRFVTVCLTKFDKENSYFHGSVYQEEQLVEVVVFKHGLTEEEEQTLLTFFKQNGQKTSKHVWQLEPSICVEIACIGFDGKQLREPRFHAFNFQIEPNECTWQSLLRQLHPLPQNINMTSADKPIWSNLNIKKDDFLLYLQKVAPYLLPFLRERLLTVIRYPHGAIGEHFYQKHCPDYAPSFVVTELVDGIEYIICNELETLLWLGNQLALEFHIPFQTRDTIKPTEIVFDLDPPSVEEFSLAVEAALQMKAIFDQFKLESFVKTSGGKGLQVYIPLPGQQYSYEETRVFTEFVCRFLCEQQPNWFTTERLKKNRGNKLYLDYIQHDEGKTIIAPYSPRGSEYGQVATPLHWNEVNTSLTPAMFTLPAVLERLEHHGDPFIHLRLLQEQQVFGDVLAQLFELVKK
ncbi:DNA ligase D [Alkalihalobacillus deserti]|uniref:DNA ligase D n=1 Tax=Alkalihalobacillus deserti TaxID=2879466 RepID=UPI001D15689B|nr:DNA ligase D [Alkalihalobacillus deserti]